MQYHRHQPLIENIPHRGISVETAYRSAMCYLVNPRCRNSYRLLVRWSSWQCHNRGNGDSTHRRWRDAAEIFIHRGRGLRALPRLQGDDLQPHVLRSSSQRFRSEYCSVHRRVPRKFRVCLGGIDRCNHRVSLQPLRKAHRVALRYRVIQFVE